MTETNPEFIKQNRLRPDLTGVHRPQHIGDLANRLGTSVTQVRTWRNKRANGIRAERAIEKTSAGWRLRPQYRWTKGSTMHLALGLDERNGGLANEFSGPGVVEYRGERIARRHDTQQGMWMYALVDEHYQPAPATTSPKGAFLRIWDRGSRGMVVVFDDFYDQSVSWHYWGTGIGTRDEAMAAARESLAGLATTRRAA